jgi:lysophospholipase L1-like esterase
MRKYHIIFLGDSFTSCPGLSKNDAWTSLLKDDLRKSFKDQLELEFSISTGIQENTRGVLERIQKDVLFLKPDIVAVQYGTNDSTHWISNKGSPIVSQQAFKANLVEIIEKCRRFNISRIMFVTNHSVALDRNDINGLTPDENTQIYDQITCEIASRYGCLVANIRKSLKDIEPRKMCQSDLIHVNKYGAKLYAKTVTPVLKRLLEELYLLDEQASQGRGDD